MTMALQGQSVKLREFEPWPDQVDGGRVLIELTTIFLRHLLLPDSAAEAMALWVVHTHAFDATDVSPCLVFESPEKRCGKTTALKIISRIVPRQLMTSNISDAAIFRLIQDRIPTLIIDEADSFMLRSEDARGILNSGHTRDGAFVVRCVGENHEPREFSTWAPKVIALIGKLHPTLEDRSIVVNMRRKQSSDCVERLGRDGLSNLETIARKCARWAIDNKAAIEKAGPESPAELDDRAVDNWLPLLSIAEAAGGEWPGRAKRAALTLSNARVEEDCSDSTMLLVDLRTLFNKGNADRIVSAKLCGALAEMEERPWPEYCRGGPITPSRLAALLRPFGIGPVTIRIGEQTAKGYKLDDLKDSFDRYLGPEEAVTTSQPNSAKRFDDALEPSQVRHKRDLSRHASTGNSAPPDDLAADVTTTLRHEDEETAYGEKGCDVVTPRAASEAGNKLKQATDYSSTDATRQADRGEVLPP